MGATDLSLVVASALVLLVCCAKSNPAQTAHIDPHELVPISPDDLHYCDVCPCKSGSVLCPGRIEQNLCTLSRLWHSQRPRWGPEKRVLFADPYVTGAWNCGKYVVIEELCGTDCGGEYAYDASTGRIAASRIGGGYAWLVCKDGYRSNWTTTPPGFIFPKREGCSALDVRELALVDGGLDEPTGD